MSELAVRDNQSYMLSPAEYALLEGDLSKLSEEERTTLYNTVCQSLGLNPMTGPFGYIRLNGQGGKLTLYAKKDCTEQLRKIHGVAITELTGVRSDGVYLVTAKAQDATGRYDVSTGAVPIEGLRGDALCNALMKAETKAKRRVTLSICGLGVLDESEASSIPNVRMGPPETHFKTDEVPPRAVADDGRPYDAGTGEVYTDPAPVEQQTAARQSTGAKTTQPKQQRPAASPTNTANGTCPECHAPEGKPHATRCSFVLDAPAPNTEPAAPVDVEPSDDAEEGDPFGELVYDTQLQLITKLCGEIQRDIVPYVHEQYSIRRDQLTTDQAAALIKKLQASVQTVGAMAR